MNEMLVGMNGIYTCTDAYHSIIHFKQKPGYLYSQVVAQLLLFGKYKEVLFSKIEFAWEYKWIYFKVLKHIW